MIKDNPQYQALRVTPGTFIPDAGLDYPTDATIRMVDPPHCNEFVMDEHYPYYEDSFHYRFNRFLCYLKNWALVYFLQKLIYGLKIEGREVMKKYEKEFAGGAITICNHAYKWDVPAIIMATRKTFYIPMFGRNMMTKDFWHMKYVGGIPVPSSMAAMKKYNEAFDKHHELGHWFHVFPEGIRWDFYKPLKPFMKGAFTMAYKYNMPLLPLYINYRPRTGLRKWFGKADVPLITVTIGEPIFPDTSATRKEEVDRLLHTAHAQMLRMGGIIENPWPVEG